MGALVGFSALWLVAVATSHSAGYGRARRAVWAVALLVAVVAAAMALVWGFAPDTLPAPFWSRPYRFYSRTMPQRATIAPTKV